MSQMISSGSAAAMSLTKSHSPRGATASTMRRARSRTISSTRATVRGVNPLLTSRRSLVWRGASMLIIEPKNSSISIGRSPMFEPFPEMNTSGLRLTVHTSSQRVTDQNPGPLGSPGYSNSSCHDTGRSRRRTANAPSRSASGRLQNATSPSLISSARSSLLGGAIMRALYVAGEGRSTAAAAIGSRRSTHRQDAAEVVPLEEDLGMLEAGRAQHRTVLLQPIRDEHVLQGLALLRDLDLGVAVAALQVVVVLDEQAI